MAEIPVCVAYGDGIGPEIMKATLRILKEAGSPIKISEVEIGKKVYLSGHSAGIAPETWEIIKSSRAFLKAPVTTPQGGGFKSLNVTIRTALGLFANVRPCVSYHPFIKTKHPSMNVVIIRENEEDLYAGIEYRQSEESVHALKIITRPGCDKIIRYAFEYALANDRKKVTCFTKDNILKISDGLFHKVFAEIAQKYNNIENEHWIIDIGAAKLADNPTNFDVVVLPNLYGDILSDIAAQIAGSVGLAGSANIGAKHAMFEAIHGSAPRRAGKNLANPSGLIMAAIMMLAHVGLPKEAALIHNAWLKTIEEGIHTYDIFEGGVSRTKAGTQEFAKAVAERLGRHPETLRTVKYSASQNIADVQNSKAAAEKKIVGIDVFIRKQENEISLQKKIADVASENLRLTMIADRGVMIWPRRHPEATCSDIWRCRFQAQNRDRAISNKEIARLLNAFAEAGLDFVQTEQLCEFNGIAGYTLSQDEQ